MIIENYPAWSEWLINYFKNMGASVSTVKFTPINIMASNTMNTASIPPEETA